MKNTEKTCKKTCGRLKMAADGKPEAQANIKDEKVRTQKRASAAKDKSMRQSGGAGGALAGAAAGLVNGLFGGGGGMIVVPALIYLLKKDPRHAHATAIMIILPMSIISGLFYASFGSFDLASGIPATIGVTAGGAIGALLLKKLSAGWITVVFSLVMAAAGVKMLFF